MEYAVSVFSGSSPVFTLETATTFIYHYYCHY